MLRTLKAILKPVLLKAPIAVNATGTSDAVNLADANSVMFLVDVGSFDFTTDDYVALSLLESDDDVTYADVGSDDMIAPESGTVAKLLDAAGDKDAVHAIHYKGNKKYVKVKYAETGTVSVVLGVTAITGHHELQPPL